MSTSCPTCGWTGGFHDDTAHADARDRIPPRLTRPSGRAAFDAWLADQWAKS